MAESENVANDDLESGQENDNTISRSKLNHILHPSWTCLLRFVAWNMVTSILEIAVGILAFEISSQRLQQQVFRTIVFPLYLPHAIGLSVSAPKGIYVLLGNFVGFYGVRLYYLSRGVHLLTSLRVFLLLLVAGVGTSEVQVSGYLLRKLLCRRGKKIPTIDTLADALYYFLSTAAPAVCFEAVITLIECVAHMVKWSDFILYWTTWWLGVLAATITISPCIIHCFAWKIRRSMLRWTKVAEITITAALTAILLIVVYTLALNTYVKPLPYLLFPIIMYTGFRFNRVGWALVLCTISMVCTWATVKHKGALYHLSGGKVQPGVVIQVELFVSVSAVVAISLAAAVREKHQLAKRLERLNENLESEVLQRTYQLVKTNEELTISQRKAEEASQAKTEFLTNMSHEIRTPIHGVLGMTALMLLTELTQEQRENMSTINECADVLLHIINSILDLAKIEAGLLEVDTSVFQVRHLIDSTMHILEPRVKRQNVSLLWDVDESVPQYLLGDRGKVQQCILNLVGNALKFTHSGFVRVDVMLARGDLEFDGISPKIKTKKIQAAGDFEILFKISDTGIGVKKDKLEDMFCPFTQADGSISRLYGGTGLGLSIVNRFVELMGGHIVADSELGKGSTFCVFIPFSPQQKGQEVPDYNILPTNYLPPVPPHKVTSNVPRPDPDPDPEPEPEPETTGVWTGPDLEPSGLKPEFGKLELPRISPHFQVSQLNVSYPADDECNPRRQHNRDDFAPQAVVEYHDGDDANGSFYALTPLIIHDDYSSEYETIFPDTSEHANATATSIFTTTVTTTTTSTTSTTSTTTTTPTLVQDSQLEFQPQATAPTTPAAHEHRHKSTVDQKEERKIETEESQKQPLQRENEVSTVPKQQQVEEVATVLKQETKQEQGQQQLERQQDVLKTEVTKAGLQATVLKQEQEQQQQQKRAESGVTAAGVAKLSSSPLLLSVANARKEIMSPHWNILLAEDNIVNQRVASRQLQIHGHVVTIVKDGSQAVEKMHTDRDTFDLVLMDVQMPNMDGLEATRRIREEESNNGFKRKPIIGLTANAMQGYNQTCFAAGMDEYVRKPFQINHLLSTIEALLVRTSTTAGASSNSFVTI